MSKRTLFEKVISILPREKLEELSEVERPWTKDRKELETIVVARDSGELREELVQYVSQNIGRRA